MDFDESISPEFDALDEAREFARLFHPGDILSVKAEISAQRHQGDRLKVIILPHGKKVKVVHWSISEFCLQIEHDGKVWEVYNPEGSFEVIKAVPQTVKASTPVEEGTPF